MCLFQVQMSTQKSFKDFSSVLAEAISRWLAPQQHAREYLVTGHDKAAPVAVTDASTTVCIIALED